MAETDLAAVTKGVIPYFTVEGAAEAAEFYKAAFGAVEVRREAAEDGKRLMHCHLVINGGSIMLCDTFPEHGFDFAETHCFTNQLVLDDGQAWWDRAVAAGCEVVTPFQLMFWGDRYGQLKDPFKIRWAINSPAKPA